MAQSLFVQFLRQRPIFPYRGNHNFASELKGRAFMVSRLENTWRRLNAQKTQRTSTATNTNASRTTTRQPQSTPQPSKTIISPASHLSAPRVVATPTQPSASTPKPNYATLIDYTRYRSDTIPYTLGHDGGGHRYYIPEKVMELFENEFDYRKTANWKELTNLAVALFIGMAGGPDIAPSGGGGGSSTDNNWGRDKDEDNLRWARRCAKAATQKLGKQPKSGYRR